MVQFIFNEENLKKFLDCEHTPQTIFGHSPHSLAEEINFKADFSLPNKRMSRQAVFDEIEQRGNALEILLIIMAWGGINRKHCAKLIVALQNNNAALETFSCWVNNLKSGRLTRQQAYEGFKSLITAHNIPGIGPAYYTKLIFFLSQGEKSVSRGYIMDQWTAKSVDLLLSEIIVEENYYSGSLIKISPHLTRATVYPSNESDRYELFCQFTDEVGNKIKSREVAEGTHQSWGEIAEERMFSQGRGKGEWRNYVKENWTKKAAINLVSAIL